MRPHLLACILLAGCAAPFTSVEPEATEEGDRVSYFHSAMTLADSAEENVSAVRTGGFYESWAAGEDYPTWYADPPEHDVLVTEATVTLMLQATGPVVESRRFPDIMVYGGAGDAWMGFGSRTDLVAFQPGQTYEIEVELEMPPGGLWLAPDVGFGLKVVPVMLQQDDNADITILVGGDNDTASRVAWTTAPLTLDDVAQIQKGDAEGEVTGTIYAGPAAPATTSDTTRLPISADTRWVIAWMNTTDNVGIPDIDLGIVAPDGTTIATSGTPTPREAIRIAGPNLAGDGDYGLVVTTAGSPRASYRVEWHVGRG